MFSLTLRIDQLGSIDIHIVADSLTVCNKLLNIHLVVFIRSTISTCFLRGTLFDSKVNFF